MDAKELFKQRELYRETHMNLENSIDFWYEDTLYGRLDSFGNAVYPFETNLKQVVGGDCIFALNFVADAYADFIDHFNNQNRVNPEFRKNKSLSPKSLTPKKGWQPINQIYHRQAQNIYEVFYSNYLQREQRLPNIRNFDDFADQFLNYVELVGVSSPFTRTGIINGLLCSPNISGLCLELSLADHATDYEKHVDFFRDSIYTSFQISAKEYGFMIDKNAPWRIVADISSKKMARYMGRYGIRPETMYEQCFHKSYVYDIPSIKVYLEGFYKSFIAAQPLSSFPERDIIKSVGLSNKYDDKYWITMYMKIRQSEVLDKLTESEFNKRLKEIRTYNVDTAAYYVNRSFLGKLAPTIIKS